MKDEKHDELVSYLRATLEKTLEEPTLTEEAGVFSALAALRLLSRYQVGLTPELWKVQSIKHHIHDTRQKTEHGVHYVFATLAFFTDTTCWCDNEGKLDGIRYHFVGLADDVLVADYLLKIFDGVIYCAWEAYKQEAEYQGNRSTTIRARLKRSFNLAIAERVSQKLATAKEEQNRANALMGRDLTAAKQAIIEAAFPQLELKINRRRKYKTFPSLPPVTNISQL